MVTEGEELVREQCMLCRHGRHAVGLRVNTLRTCTEQQTVQVLTHVYRYTRTLQTSHKVLPATSISLGYPSSSTDKSIIMITAGKHGIQRMQG